MGDDDHDDHNNDYDGSQTTNKRLAGRLDKVEDPIRVKRLAARLDEFEDPSRVGAPISSFRAVRSLSVATGRITAGPLVLASGRSAKGLCYGLRRSAGCGPDVRGRKFWFVGRRGSLRASYAFCVGMAGHAGRSFVILVSVRFKWVEPNKLGSQYRGSSSQRRRWSFVLFAGSHKSERRRELRNLYNKKSIQVRGNGIVCESFDSAINLRFRVDAEGERETTCRLAHTSVTLRGKHAHHSKVCSCGRALTVHARWLMQTTDLSLLAV